MSTLTVRHGAAGAPDDTLVAAWSGGVPSPTLDPAAVEARWPGSLLLVAERDGAFAGRCVLSPAGRRFQLRPPALPHLSEIDGAEVTARMASRARELVPAGCGIEAFPADDVRHDAVWRAGMTVAGYREVAATRMWELALTAVVVDRPQRALRPASRVPAAELEALVAAVRSSTCDRVDAAGEDSPREILARLVADPSASPVPGLWLVADEADDGAVGYVLGSEDEDGDVWVVDLGVRPDRRRRGLGRALIEELVARAAADGRAWVRAQIDVANTPSESAHRAAGFRVDDAVYRTWHATGTGAGADEVRPGGGVSGVGPGHRDADA